MLRKATIADCGAAYELICEMESKLLDQDRFFEIYEKQILDKRYYSLICEQDDKVIGVLNLRFEEQLHHAECIAEIMEFAIDSSYRNKGLGKEMFINACNIAKEFGCTQIEVACNQLRTNTHRFYEREGMHNFHYKFSKSLTGIEFAENTLGR